MNSPLEIERDDFPKTWPCLENGWGEVGKFSGVEIELEWGGKRLGVYRLNAVNYGTQRSISEQLVLKYFQFSQMRLVHYKTNCVCINSLTERWKIYESSSTREVELLSAAFFHVQWFQMRVKSTIEKIFFKFIIIKVIEKHEIWKTLFFVEWLTSFYCFTI